MSHRIGSTTTPGWGGTGEEISIVTNFGGYAGNDNISKFLHRGFECRQYSCGVFIGFGGNHGRQTGEIVGKAAGEGLIQYVRWSIRSVVVRYFQRPGARFYVSIRIKGDVKFSNALHNVARVVACVRSQRNPAMDGIQHTITWK